MVICAEACGSQSANLMLPHAASSVPLCSNFPSSSALSIDYDVAVIANYNNLALHAKELATLPHFLSSLSYILVFRMPTIENELVATQSMNI